MMLYLLQHNNICFSFHFINYNEYYFINLRITCIYFCVSSLFTLFANFLLNFWFLLLFIWRNYLMWKPGLCDINYLSIYIYMHRHLFCYWCFLCFFLFLKPGIETIIISLLTLRLFFFLYKWYISLLCSWTYSYFVGCQ